MAIIKKILKMLTRSTRAKGKWDRDKDYECEENYYYSGWIIGVANQKFITTIFFDKGHRYEDTGIPYHPWFLREETK